MQKQINEIEKIWTEINIGLQCADLPGVTQRIRKMVYMLKMFRINIEAVTDKPFPKMGIGKLSGRSNPKEKTFKEKEKVFKEKEKTFLVGKTILVSWY